jgi:putative dimethyl sulfoxide reductase chaperone
VDISASKAQIYKFLAEALNYPVEETLSAIQLRELAAEMSKAAEAQPQAVQEAMAPIEKLSREASLDFKKWMLALEKDYTWMFLASRPRLVHLFESVYKEGKLFQESTFEIARIYNQAGLAPKEEFKLPPDHIALEFELMAYLAFQETEALRQGNQENAEYAVFLQQKVLSEHLRSFALNVAERMAAHAKTEFYHSVAEIIKVFLSHNGSGTS